MSAGNQCNALWQNGTGTSAQNGRFASGTILGIASAIYNNIMIAAWIYMVFRLFLDIQVAIVPFLWAYAVATVPFGIMGMQEGPENTATNTILLLIQITSIATGVARYAGAGPFELVIIAGVFIVIATAVNILLMTMGRAVLRGES